MNNQDRQTFDELSRAFKADAQNTKLPERLSKENMVAMLKAKQEEPREIKLDFSEKNNIVKLKWISAVAAVFVIALGITAFVRSGAKIPVIGSQDAFKYFESVNPIKYISSDKDYENAVQEIVGKSKEKTTSDDKTGKKNTGKPGKEDKKDGLFAEEFDSADGSYILAKVDSDTDLSSKSDIVKSDGKYLYVLSSVSDPKNSSKTESIKIYGIVPLENMSDKPVGEIKLYESGKADSEIECCELYLSGDSLVAVMKKKGSQGAETTVAVRFDISNPTGRIICTDECIQDGAYVTSSLQGDKLTLVTRGSLKSDSALPEFTVNGSDIQATNIQKVENKAENSFLFITATELGVRTESASTLVLLGCSGGVSVTSNGICVTRTFAAVDGEAKKSEIYRFGSALTLAGFTVIDGTVVGGANSGSDGYVKAVVSDGKKLSAYTFNTDMDLAGKCEGFGNAGDVSIAYYGKCAYITGKNNTAVIDFTDPMNLSVKNDSMAVRKDDVLCRVSDKVLVSVNETDKSIKCFDAFGSEIYSVALKNAKPMVDDSRAIAVSDNGSLIGIPVLKTDSENKYLVSAYMVINLGGEKPETVGTFVHSEKCSGDAASRATFSEGGIYTVSGSKIVANSLDGTVNKSIAF